MVEVAIWLLIGTLNGWIGYLASRTGKRRQVECFLIVGMAGSLLGGVLAEHIGLPEIDGTIDAVSGLSAILMSAIVVVVYSVISSAYKQ